MADNIIRTNETLAGHDGRLGEVSLARQAIALARDAMKVGRPGSTFAASVFGGQVTPEFVTTEDMAKTTIHPEVGLLGALVTDVHATGSVVEAPTSGWHAGEYKHAQLAVDGDSLNAARDAVAAAHNTQK